MPHAGSALEYTLGAARRLQSTGGVDPLAVAKLHFEDTGISPSMWSAISKQATT